MFLFRLPQDIYQTAKVAKILLLLEKGKGEQFKGKSLNSIELQQDVYYSSESESSDKDEDLIPLSERTLKNIASLEKINEMKKNLQQEQTSNTYMYLYLFSNY